MNDSPNNTGARELPPAQGAFIWYPYAPSPDFPVFDMDAGRAAMAGPVYHHAEQPPPAFPRYFDDSLIIYDFVRHTLYAVRFDERGELLHIHRLFYSLPTRGPIDMEVEASHTYPEPGVQIIRLGVRDPDGNEGFASLRVVGGQRGGHDTHAHPLETRLGCEGVIALDDEHDDGANLFYVLTASYIDRGGTLEARRDAPDGPRVGSVEVGRGSGFDA